MVERKKLKKKKEKNPKEASRQTAGERRGTSKNFKRRPEQVRKRNCLQKKNNACVNSEYPS